MNTLGKDSIVRLIDEARLAFRNSYSPYSNFAVGAAVMLSDGRIFRGTNVENVSYGLTICAERAAVCNAIAHGGSNISAIAIFTEQEGVTPCGACRQFIAEFGSDIAVVYRSVNGTVVHSISELLPVSFSQQTLAHNS